MNKKQFRHLIRECIFEVLTETDVKTLDKDGNWVDKPDGLTTPTPQSTPGKPPKIDVNKQMADLKASNQQMRKMGLDGLDETDEVPSADPGGFVEDEYNTLFQSGKTPITTDELDNIALSHIKDAKNALDVAIKIGVDIAEKNGYTFDDIKGEFTKNQPVQEMTSTGCVQGFLGKNWVDPDPDRKRMKNIAAKSVGGKVT